MPLGPAPCSLPVSPCPGCFACSIAPGQAEKSRKVHFPYLHCGCIAERVLSSSHVSLKSRGQPLEAHQLPPVSLLLPGPCTFHLSFRPESLLASLWDPVLRLRGASVPTPQQRADDHRLTPPKPDSLDSLHLPSGSLWSPPSSCQCIWNGLPTQHPQRESGQRAEDLQSEHGQQSGLSCSG